VHYGTASPRLILDDDRVVGFVMGGFNPDSEIDAFQAGIWRLNIAADEQGQGDGRFAVQAVAAEARRRGQKRITVLWCKVMAAQRASTFHSHRGEIGRRVDAVGACTSVFRHGSRTQ
jgi:hypothetical protein